MFPSSGQNNKWVHNDATAVECAPLVVNTASLRLFRMPTRVDARGQHQLLQSGEIGALLNGTDSTMCMWLGTDEAEHQPHQLRGSFVSMRRCGSEGTGWRYSAVSGLISSATDPSICVGYYVGAKPIPAPSSRRVVQPVPCAHDTHGVPDADWALRFNVTNLDPNTGVGMFQLAQAGPGSTLDPRALDLTPPCLGIVRDNINISVGIAAKLTDDQLHDVPPLSVSVERGDNTNPLCAFPSGSKCPDHYSVGAVFAISAGKQYVLRVAITSTRGSSVSSHDSAKNSAIATATTTRPDDVESANAAAWRRWWNASAVRLGPKRQTVEAFWYGAQYMLNCFTKNRTGDGVIPGLLGPWSLQDPVGWSDDVTLDYNVEANFYGAASSNHPEAMWPYFPTLTALIPIGQQRASLSWWGQGGHESAGFYGQMTEAMGCNCNNYFHCYRQGNGQRCPDGFGGFEGIEIPSAIGGFVDMHCSHDSAMRSTAAMAAQPYVDYFEHTMDAKFLRQQAFPFIKQVALFYASYAQHDASTDTFGFPLACAQEICNGRQQGGYHPQRSPTIDLSYAQYIFSKAVAWGQQLGEDPALLSDWTHIAAKLAPYPTTTLPTTQHPWCADSNCTGFSEATNTDTNTSAVMPANFMWPIANFAPIHPTGQVSLDADNATKTIARNTVWLVNNFSGWHPVNGICLAWPSAARLMDKHDPYPFGPEKMLDTWAQALNKTMQRNFWPSMGGGGLEQVGATQAVNELLLQSYQGVIRLFPGWPLGEPASFTTLRAVGAFLVSAAVDSAGHVGPVTILSEFGGVCTVVSPWARAIQVEGRGPNGGVPVTVKAVDGYRDRWQFSTENGFTYVVTEAS